MNNEKLKKKIADTLNATEISVELEKADIYKFADALIAAGIGDVKEHRIFAGKDGSIKQLYSGEEVEQIVKERDEYKHRAEKAEKALRRKCESEADSTCPYDEKSEKCKECKVKVGDKIYCIHRTSDPIIIEWQVDEIRITDHNCILHLVIAGTKNYRNESSQYYGKWWFTTREAAEARLKELKGEKK